jgi:transposase-like protein
MAPLSYHHHRFPPAVIQPAVWLYLRFTPSYRDVEELLAERGLDLSYETVRRWVLKFGPTIARNLRCQRARPSNRSHLDEMVVTVAGRDRMATTQIMNVYSRSGNRPSASMPADGEVALIAAFGTSPGGVSNEVC